MRVTRDNSLFFQTNTCYFFNFLPPFHFSLLLYDFFSFIASIIFIFAFLKLCFQCYNYCFTSFISFFLATLHHTGDVRTLQHTRATFNCFNSFCAFSVLTLFLCCVMFFSFRPPFIFLSFSSTLFMAPKKSGASSSNLKGLVLRSPHLTPPPQIFFHSRSVSFRQP